MKMLIKKNAEGITLLELLIVLAVIGIAATFAIPNLSSFTTSRVAEKDLATIRSLIDYAKTTSFSKSKTMVLVQTKNYIKISELRSNDPTQCLGSVDDDKESSKTCSQDVYPFLQPENVVSILVSSSFLKME